MSKDDQVLKKTATKMSNAKTNTVAIQDNNIVITGKKSSSASRVFLWFLVVSCTLFPMAILITTIALGKDLFFGLVIIFIILWLLAWFMLRAVLWNTYGKEIITLGEKEISYIADYRLFKDGKRAFIADETEFIKEDQFITKKIRHHTLLLKSSEETLSTALSLDAEEFEKINRELGVRYGKEL